MTEISNKNISEFKDFKILENLIQITEIFRAKPYLRVVCATTAVPLKIPSLLSTSELYNIILYVDYICTISGNADEATESHRG